MNSQAKVSQHPRPHKSTTHEEFYFHLNPDRFNEIFQPSDAILFEMYDAGVRGGTVFFRKEGDGSWYGEAAFLSSSDQFSRKIGRQQARKRYFLEGAFPCPEVTTKPTMEDAIDLFRWSLGEKFFAERAVSL